MITKFMIIMFSYIPLAFAYESQTKINQRLQQWALTFESKISVYELGRSLEERPINAIRFKRQKYDDKPTPKIILIAGTHGDEIIGRELMIELTDYLLSLKAGHGHLKFLDHAELWIIPCHNPDGCEHKMRTDKKGRDLNRYFPRITIKQAQFPASSDQSQTIFSDPPEVAAIQKLFQENQFQIGLTFHGGEIPTVNYPWDFFDEPFAFTELAVNLAKSYAIHNPQMRKNTQFASGIANGHHWYSIEGGMQDWALAYHDCLMLTPELTLVEWPPLHERRNHIEDNFSATLAFINNIMQGIGFYYNDTTVKGRVLIRKTHENSKLLVKDVRFAQGFYYSVMAPGKYDFEVQPEMGEIKHFEVVIHNNFNPKIKPFWIRLE